LISALFGKVLSAACRAVNAAEKFFTAINDLTLVNSVVTLLAATDGAGVGVGVATGVGVAFAGVGAALTTGAGVDSTRSAALTAGMLIIKIERIAIFFISKFYPGERLKG
jgi:hypothetical protein